MYLENVWFKNDSLLFFNVDHPLAVCMNHTPKPSDVQIKQWDLRMQKPVLSYEGLFNQHSKLPFHIDETQSLLYAGQYGCVRIW